MRRWIVRVWYRGTVRLEPTIAKSKAMAINNVRGRLLKKEGLFVREASFEAEEMP